MRDASAAGEPRIHGTIIDTKIEGHQIRFFVQNADDHIQAYHFRGRFYEEEELKIIAKYVCQDAHIIDVGANVGNHALFFAKIAKAKIVRAFEVNPLAYRILEINVLLNRADSVDMSCLGIALADTEMTLELSSEQKDNLGGTRFRRSESGRFRALPGDACLSGSRVNFLKIDVEGMELEVLRGFRQTVRTWRPGIFIEVGQENLATFREWRESNRYEIVEETQRYGGLWNYVIIPCN